MTLRAAFLRAAWAPAHRNPRAIRIGLASITVLLGLVLGLFGSGLKYGMYSDDYSHKLWAYDPVRGSWRPRLELEQPYLRPMGQMLVVNLANALPEYEVPVRLFWAVNHLANVLLAGYLAYRLTRSTIAAALAAGVQLVPVQAHEALFWHSGAASALPGTLLALVAMHLFLSALRSNGRWWRYGLLGLVAVGLIPQFYEQAAGSLVVLLLFPAFERPMTRGKLLRALLLFVASAGLLFLHWWFVLRHSGSLVVRGGLQPSLYSLVFEGLPKTLRGMGRALWFGYGAAGFSAAWEMGARAIAMVPVAAAATVLLAIAACTAMVLFARREGESPTDRRRLLLLVAVGWAWFLAGFLPFIVVRDQGVPSRVLYPPWVGLALASSGTTALVLRRLPARWLWAAGMLLAGALVTGVIMMAGLERVYQLRHELDQTQLAALVRAVPSLPPGQVIVVPVDSEENPVAEGGPGAAALNAGLAGVFETSWSADAAISMRYGKDDVSAVWRSRWRGLELKGIRTAGATAELLFADLSVLATRCLAFSYRGGAAVLHDWVVVEQPDHSLLRIELPLARQVAAPGTAFEELFLKVSAVDRANGDLEFTQAPTQRTMDLLPIILMDR